jgi:tetratricopeptide (TPR) repeat protein
MKRIIVLALILLAMIGLFAANQTRLLARSPATATDTMLTASQLYEAGQYAQAAQAYQQLVDQGFADGALYYNLANAHFKQGDYGRAVLNYLRAERLDPRDPDVQANLELARAQTVDQLQVVEQQDLFDVLSRASQSWLSLNGLAMVALAAWILVVFLMIVLTGIKSGGIWRKGVRNSLLLAAVVLAVGVLLLGTRLYTENHQKSTYWKPGEAGKDWPSPARRGWRAGCRPLPSKRLTERRSMEAWIRRPLTSTDPKESRLRA